MVMAVPGTFEYFRSLGNILVLKGFCSEEEIEEAVLQQAEKTNGSKPLLGDVLVDMGVCSREEVDEALAYQDEVEIEESLKKRELAQKDLEQATQSLQAQVEVMLKE